MAHENSFHADVTDSLHRKGIIPQQAITQHAWFKKPDQIEAQLQSWGIYATNEEKELYFSTIGMFVRCN